MALVNKQQSESLSLFFLNQQRPWKAKARTRMLSARSKCVNTHTHISPSHINFPILITSNYIAERVLMQSNLAELSRWRRTAHSKMSWSCDKSYWNKQLLDNPTHWWIKSSEDKTLRVLAPTPPYQAGRWDSGSNEVKQFFLFLFF